MTVAVTLHTLLSLPVSNCSMHTHSKHNKNIGCRPSELEMQYYRLHRIQELISEATIT